MTIEVPPSWAAAQVKFNGVAGRAFVARLPRLVDSFLATWRLRVDGAPMHGAAALVLPVVGVNDGALAVLKLQLPDDETGGEPDALRAWGGDGAVRLLRHDEATGTMLLERLESAQSLDGVEVHEAVVVIARMLAHLTARRAPAGLRRLGDVAPRMLNHWSQVRSLAGADDRRLLDDAASAVREVADEPGDRLLHWDLHYENVLAARPEAVASGRATWLAIDPKPLAGDPGFELLPAMCNRFDPADIAWRFDAMTEVLDLDRGRARAWTLARVLQNCVWDLEGGRELDPEQLEIARQLE